MAKEGDNLKRTSRRQFTRAAITAAVVGSLAACKSESPGPTNQTAKQDCPECPATITTHPDYTEIVYMGGITGEDHIPPMRFEGGGSVVIDFAHKLNQSGSGNGPFTYEETDVPDEDDRYGEIKGATVISETDTGSFIAINTYSQFPAGTQLWIWYQEIDPTNPSGDDEIDYKPLPNPLPDPDVVLTGGRPNSYLKLTIKRKGLEVHKSHKKSRPTRRKHTGGNGQPTHFRIGLWRFVKNNGASTIVEKSGAENYNIYVDFHHFNAQ